MKLFGQIFRTVVNVAALPVTLPVAVAKDAVNFLADGRVGASTEELVERLKREAEE